MNPPPPPSDPIIRAGEGMIAAELLDAALSSLQPLPGKACRVLIMSRLANLGGKANYALVKL